MSEAAERLRRIKRFDQLVAYLRDVLEWPMEDYPFEDLTFDWDAEELGIDLKTAAKIQEIKQLRPLASGQEWGIFFVKFEPKQLPVVALRRLLNKLVIKKRASAQSSDTASWRMHDLLFVSQYGEGDQRKITFANFTAGTGGAIPTLKVLDWDEDDTGMKLQHVDQQLRAHLCWPKDEDDIDAWRSQWSAAFTLRHRQVIRTAKELATSLADLCRDICDETKKILEVETDKGPVRKLFQAFQQALIHDLTEADFADTFAQTITYGLFSTAVSGTVSDESLGSRTYVDTERMVQMVPPTNPFLREMLQTFLTVGGRKGKLDFDELGIQEVVELLNDDRTDLNAVLRDFGNRGQGEDPVIHFYEDFLKQYDKERKVERGVFYTPQPVVSYIVRSVHELLQTEFGLEDGLADTTTWGEMAARHKDDGLTIPNGMKPDDAFVQILDPATGTGTFLVEVIDVIHRTMTEKWEKEGKSAEQCEDVWNEYVPKHLLPRLYGYELMMAPYAIAHVKIGLKLKETGYQFGSAERARIYLTNALEPGTRSIQKTLGDWFPALAHEAEAVNRIKRVQPITVVIGNPPYSGISFNMTPWIDGLLKGTMPDGTSTASYYHVDGQPLGERKLWLQDDYVKFIRWSQHRLTHTGVGIHGFISNHGYLDNPTFRGMRWSIMDAFDNIRVLDLHGNLKKRETPPDGGRDVNVFDIQQGVGIGLFVRRPDHQRGIDSTTVQHADLWGDRDVKYRWLIEHDTGTTSWESVGATEPYYLLRPYDESEVGDFYDWPAISDVMNVNVTGVVTARDDFVIDFDETPLRRRMADMRDASLSDQAIRDKYFVGKGAKKYPPGDSRGWKLPKARQKLRDDKEWNERYAPILYRPFDVRQIYYVPWMVDWPRTEAMPHMLAGDNLALITSRMTKGESFKHVQATRGIVEVICMSPKTSNNGFVFPLYLYPGVGKSVGTMFSTWPEGKGGRRPNLDPRFVESIEQAAGMKFVSDGRGDLRKYFGPEDVLAYIYAVFHCPEYRRRFEPMLKLDFPRVPPPGATEPFVSLAKLGRGLLALHLLESPLLDTPIAKYQGPANPEVEKASYADETAWLDRVQTCGFVGVPEEVWNFHIGGYQVCEKWLKDRQAKGGKNPRPSRVLTADDINHYHRIVVALSETIRLMAEIDEVINQHGGWPDAFVTEPTTDE